MSLPFIPALWAVLLYPVQTTKGQSPVTSIAAAYQTQNSLIDLYTALPVGLGAFGGCTGTLYTYTFSNGLSNQYKLSSFNANGSTYLIAPASAATVKLRRVDNANVSGSRNIMYMETTAASAVSCPAGLTLSFKPPYVDDMEALLAAGMLNQGTDNVFTNSSNGDGNNNNVERVDVIFSSGLNTASPAQAGFAIFDRGANYQHDPFKIVAITSLDANGDPNGFGAVKSCTGGNGSNNNGNWGHPSTANGNKQFAAYVLRKDAAEAKLRVSSNINQEMGGVFYSFSDLGITAGQPLYGYALLGPDGLANPTTAQLLSLNNSPVYPTATTEASGGGLDLVAVNTVFATGSYVVLPLTVNMFTGYVQNAQAALQWRLTGSTGNETISLQRSADGVNFQPLYTDNNKEGAYRDTDMPSGSCYYRLCITTPTGGPSYSQTLALHNTAANISWKVFPTIVERGQLLTLQGLTDGAYTVSFYDVSGRCRKTTVQAQNGDTRIGLPGTTLPAGIYWLNLSHAGRPVPGNRKIFIR
jgi:hypothetical protein